MGLRKRNKRRERKKKPSRHVLTQKNMEPESLGMELQKTHICYQIQVILMQSIGSQCEGTFEIG